MNNQYIELIKKNKHSLKNIPEKYFSKDLCLYIIDEYGLEFIPSYLINEELINYALINPAKYHRNSNYIPEKYFTPEFFLDHVKKNHTFLISNYKREITREIALEFARKMNVYAHVCFIPKKYLDYDQELNDILNNRFPQETNYMQNIKSNKMQIYNVPKLYMNKNICLEIVKSDATHLSYIPGDILDKDIIAETIKIINSVFADYEKKYNRKIPGNLYCKQQEIIDNFNNFTNYYDYNTNNRYYSIDSINIVLKELVGPNCFYKEDDCAYTIYENVQKVIPGYIYNSYENVETKRYIIFKKN